MRRAFDDEFVCGATMLYKLSLLGLICIAVMPGRLIAQSSSNLQPAPLCELQTKVSQGEHRTVRVEGVFLSGIEGQYLVTSGCLGKSTSVEFELRTHRLWKRLEQLSNRTNTKKHTVGDGDPIFVVFDGDFYGPRVPDPKLPENIRKIYRPGWDPMNASMTKIVVHAIQNVQPLPPDHPCAAPESDPHQWPCFLNPAPDSGGATPSGPTASSSGSK